MSIKNSKERVTIRQVFNPAYMLIFHLRSPACIDQAQNYLAWLHSKTKQKSVFLFQNRFLCQVRREAYSFENFKTYSNFLAQKSGSQKLMNKILQFSQKRSCFRCTLNTIMSQYNFLARKDIILHVCQRIQHRNSFQSFELKSTQNRELALMDKCIAVSEEQISLCMNFNMIAEKRLFQTIYSSLGQNLYKKYQKKNMCGIWALITKGKFTNEKLEAFRSVRPRGPDKTILHLNSYSIIGFHRLAIMDLTSRGQQPFCVTTKNYKYTVTCNGEIYNYRDLIDRYNLKVESDSDCGVLLPLFLELKEDFISFNRELLGEYALLITREDIESGQVRYWTSVDPLSVRPLFYFSSQTEFGVSSLLGGLSSFRSDVLRLDQGTYIEGVFDPINQSNKIISQAKYTIQPSVKYEVEDQELYAKIVETVTEAVERRLMTERPLGCLLSGGLDSSLVASIASSALQKKGQKLRTFSIGMQEGTDLIFARQVANHIGSEHTEFIYTPEEGLDSLKDVLKVTETFDITTIRASVGQYLIAKKISEKTDVTVVLNGDGADECQMGYLYFYLAPDAVAAKADRDRLVQEIHLYDGLRVDRNIAHFGLESRVPFLDRNFVDLYYQIDPSLIIPTQERMEKYLLRRAFEVVSPDVLPKSVLWRKKEAFSDGVSSKQKSWYQIVKEHTHNSLLPELLKELAPSQARRQGTVPDRLMEKFKFEGLQPVCLESQYYRMLHNELFNKNHQMFSHYWLPSWANVSEPSARVLSMYQKKDVPITATQ